MKDKKSLKSGKAAVIISAVAVSIAAVNLLISGIYDLQIWTAIALLCSNITIMCVCLSSFSKRKKESSVIQQGQQ